MKRLLLLLLLPLLLTPTAHAVENFNYDGGYRACIRHFFRRYNNEWVEKKGNYEKDEFRSHAHKECK